MDREKDAGLLVSQSPALSQFVGRAGRRRRLPPNVVLIMADDLGAECLGCFGSASYKTPVLDQLAETGVLFRNCHAQPLCTPSRVKIMTGKYNFRNYTEFSSLPSGQKTFANMLHDAGYATCIAGKWQLGGDENSLASFGFDEYDLFEKTPMLPGQDTPESAEARKYLETILHSVNSDQRKQEKHDE